MFRKTFLQLVCVSLVLAKNLNLLETKTREKRQLFPGLGRGGGNGAFGSCMAWLLEMLLNGFAGSNSPFQVAQPSVPETSFPGNLLGPLVQETGKNNGIFGFQKKSVPSFSANDISEPVLRQRDTFPSVKKTIDIGTLHNRAQTGPQEKVFLDTGKDFDRFLVHRLKGVDALGFPLFNNWQSRGAVWNNGDVEIVNTDGNDILGGTISANNKGFNIPIGTIFNAVKTLGRIGGVSEERIRRKRKR